MADKRATPETPDGVRRRKRAAPTIDLQATEIPPPSEPAAAATSEPEPEPPPASLPPEEPVQAEAPPSSPPPPPPSSPRAAGYGPAVGAGVVGAVAAIVVLAALWYGGVLPARQAAAPDTTAVNALSQRVSRIEAEIAKLPQGDRAVNERLASIDNAMKSLGVALTALSRRSDTIAADASKAREGADAAQKAVADVRAGLNDAPRNTADAVPPGALDALQQRLAALEEKVKAIAGKTDADKAARLALSAAALRSAVERGAPYAEALTQAKALGADAAGLAPLEAFAQAGLPDEAALARELSALVPALRKASGAQDKTSGGFLERLQANAGKLVRIRPLDAASGDAPADIVARIEAEAAKADIDGALADLAKLPAEARKPADAWIAKARQRQAALTAARGVAATSAGALGKP
jgi:hypothetical protein